MIVVSAIVVIACLVAMASGRVPPTLALASAIAVAGILGLAPVPDLLSGLSNSGIVTVAAMLVIAKGVIHTGVVSRVTWRLLAGITTAQQALLRLIAPVGVVSALINTTPIVAMLIPAAKELQQTRGIPARQVLLPTAHATTLAGSTTLIGTSSNLLIAGIAGSAGVTLSLLSFAPVALPVCLVGWVVILVTAPRMFRAADQGAPPEPDWRVEIKVSPRALAIGREAADIGLDATLDYQLVDIIHDGDVVPPSTVIQPDDRLVFAATERGVRTLWSNPRLGLSAQRLYVATIANGENGRLRDMEAEDDLTVIAAQSNRPLRDTAARPGDTCFVTVSRQETLREHDSLALASDVAGKAPQPGKTWRALLILLAVVVVAAFGITPVEIAALSGSVLMVVAGVLTPRAAARALDWNMLFILAGSVGLGAIVVSSGIAAEMSKLITNLAGGSALGIVVVLAVSTAILTNLVTNAAAASILTPVALGICETTGLSPFTVLALIGTCISFTFINPFSHQSNIMVMRPGGYSTGSFVRFGIPLLLVSLVSVSVVGWLLLR